MTHYAITKTEHGEQSALFDWALAQSNIYPELRLLFAVPNGGHRHVAVAARMKAEGVKAGVPDMFLPAARGQWHGLFIEMKVGRNKPSEHQVQMLQALKKQGYAAIVVWSFEEATEAITKYLEEK